VNMTLELTLPEQGTHALGVGKLSSAPYTSEEHFELEKKHIFSRCWLMAGRAADLTKTGDFFTFEIDALATSLVIIRGKDSRIRAFRNACTHRGTKILTEDRGRVKGGMICPYHGWAFGLDGDLLNVPDEETFGCLDKSKEGLHEVALDIWGGFVFVNLDPKPQWSLREYLAPLSDDLSLYLGDEQWSWSFGWKAKVKSNWKSPIDAQIEGYHINYGHRRTIARNVTAEGTRPFPFPDSIGVPGGLHLFRPEKLGVQTPIGLLSAKFGATSLYSEPEKAFEARHSDVIEMSRHPRWILDNYPLFPNTVLFVQQGQIFIQRTMPLSPHECIWEVDFYHSQKTGNFGEFFSSEQGRIQVRDVLSEDLKIVEGIQESFRSGAIREISLSKQEVLIRAFYQKAQQFVDREGVA
jgi:phenylpropionate dioxygenase-like ring-hydroxylating dioxygenase large terminal subunit